MSGCYRLLRSVRHGVEYIGAWVVWGLFKALPLDIASAFGGGLLRLVGPFLTAHRIAEHNLRRAFPEKSDAEIKALLRGMWDNLGRTLGELPHVDAILNRSSGRVEVTGIERIHAVRDDGKCGMFYAGHLGNWELAPLLVGREGIPLHVFFRSPNNPLINGFYTRVRRGAGGELLPKGSAGAKRSLELLKKGEHLGLLADQKMNDGIPVPFFGRDAMTAPALAQFARRYQCPMVPVRVVRLKGAHFRIDIFPSTPVANTGDRMSEIRETMRIVNETYESWIREFPEQWLWVHRRWPD